MVSRLNRKPRGNGVPEKCENCRLRNHVDELMPGVERACAVFVNMQHMWRQWPGGCPRAEYEAST